MGAHAGPIVAAAIVLMLIVGGVAAGVALRPNGDPPAAPEAATADRTGQPQSARNSGRSDDSGSVRHQPAPPLDDTNPSVAADFDWTDPQAVIAAYVQARYTITASDADRRHLRHEPYLHPDAATLRLGHRAVAAPSQGRRTIEIDGVELQARVEHRGTWRVRWTQHDPGSTDQRRQRDLVLQRLDGRWLVSNDAAELDPTH